MTHPNANTHLIELTINTRDGVGRTPPLHMTGIVLVHSGNGRRYKIQSFVWNGKNDKWHFLHQECDRDGKIVSGSIGIVRPVSHIWGKRSNGEARYKVQP